VVDLPPLVPGTLLARRKRFLADVRLPDGEQVVAWCPNPGRMTSCMGAGWPVWLSAAPPGRKLAWTWELTRDPAGATILVNATRPNAVVAEALGAGQVPALAGYARLRREVKVGASRLDLSLEGHAGHPRTCFVEVKCVTLRVGPGLAAFPDAVTARGSRHLAELARLAGEGHRAVLFFAVGRDDVQAVRPADEVDPVYGRALRQAVAAGVEVHAWAMTLSLDPGGPAALGLDRALQVRLAAPWHTAEG